METRKALPASEARRAKGRAPRTANTPATHAKAPRGGARAANAQKSAKSSGRRLPDPAAFVVDPEQLLAALERGESAAQGCDREPRPERSSRRRMVSGVDLLELAETAPENEQDAAPPAPSAAPSAPSLAPPAPVLRDNETALTTSSGILVIRRRRAA